LRPAFRRVSLYRRDLTKRCARDERTVTILAGWGIRRVAHALWIYP
jgi:hypothetical protein